jgi:hypothetical protein
MIVCSLNTGAAHITESCQAAISHWQPFLFYSFDLLVWASSWLGYLAFAQEFSKGKCKRDKPKSNTDESQCYTYQVPHKKASRLETRNRNECQKGPTDAEPLQNIPIFYNSPH